MMSVDSAEKHFVPQHKRSGKAAPSVETNLDGPDVGTELLGAIGGRDFPFLQGVEVQNRCPEQLDVLY
jgi:hypothetical protein